MNKVINNAIISIKQFFYKNAPTILIASGFAATVGAGVLAVCNCFPRLRLTAEPVLRSENPHNVHPKAVKRVHKVRPAHHCCVVGADGHQLALRPG